MLKNIENTDELTIRHFLRMPLDLLRLAGVKLFSWDSEDVMTVKDKIFLVLSITILVLNVFTKISFVLFETFEDTLQMAALTIYISFATNGICKIVTLWLKRNTLHNVIINMSRTFPSSEISRKEYRLNDYYVIIMKYMRFLFTFHWTVALMFLIFPIAQSVGELLLTWTDNPTYEYRFPYIMKYPFDENRPVTYIVAFLAQFMGGVTVSIYFLGADLLLICTVHLLNMQFEYLANRIRKFKSKGYSADLKEIKHILKYHSCILEYSEQINNVFSIAILLNYLITIVVVCLIGFQVAAGSEFIDLIKFGGFLGSSLTHVYYVCLFGSSLENLSEEISEALSCHEWYDADVKYQKMLPTGIVRSQRPAFLSAFKFFKISMESFTTLINTSYKFFTLIKSRYDEKNQQ